MSDTETQTSFEQIISFRVDPADVVTGLNRNDDAIVNFICEVLAELASSDAVDSLIERLADEKLHQISEPANKDGE